MFNTKSSILSYVGAIISRTLPTNSLCICMPLTIPWCWCLCCPLVHFCKRLLWLRTKYSSYYSFSQPPVNNACYPDSTALYTNHSIGWCEPYAKGSFLIGLTWLIVLCFAFILKRQCFSGSYHALARCVQYTTQEIGNVVIFAWLHNVILILKLSNESEKEKEILSRPKYLQ